MLAQSGSSSVEPSTFGLRTIRSFEMGWLVRELIGTGKWFTVKAA
jgi:hypothetical protein